LTPQLIKDTIWVSKLTRTKELTIK